MFGLGMHGVGFEGSSQFMEGGDYEQTVFSEVG